jgi:Acyl-CoA reductase (LuxC)
MTIGTSVPIPHIIRGEIIFESEIEYLGVDGEAFTTPKLDVSSLVWPRTEPLPAAEVPVDEIIDVLAATGEQLRNDSDGLLASALESLVRTSPYERRILEHNYANIWQIFRPECLRALLDGELGGAEVIDGWRRVSSSSGHGGSVRAYPTRLIHVLAGNSPGLSALTVARGALMKGVHLLKMPSNDLLTATAVLRALAIAAPGHPVTRSFSAVYWQGGDEAVESVLFRPQFYDKLVAWGGDAAIRNAAKYLGPGFELISFDPKNSISMIGREAFQSDATIADVAARGAIDATMFNQEACTSSRFQFIEGTSDEVDRYCELLQVELGYERPLTSAKVAPPPREVREEIDALRSMDDFFHVFGEADGRGLVVRSEEPVSFFPTGKTVNVVMVPSLADAVKYVNVSTQTVGIYPAERKSELRDQLASAGVQRVVVLGANGMIPGFPHDGFYPMHRFVRWVNDED